MFAAASSAAPWWNRAFEAFPDRFRPHDDGTGPESFVGKVKDALLSSYTAPTARQIDNGERSPVPFHSLFRSMMGLKMALPNALDRVVQSRLAAVKVRTGEDGASLFSLSLALCLPYQN